MRTLAMSAVMTRLADCWFDRGAVLMRRQSLAGRPVQRDEIPDGLGFRWKHHEIFPLAPLAPAYLNFRPYPAGPLRDEDFVLAGQACCVLALERGLVFEALAGIPQAGDPLVAAFARYWRVVIRRSVTLHTLQKEILDGRRRIARINEPVVPGTRILSIDNVIAEGGSKRETVDVIKEAGGVIADILVCVDWPIGGTADMARRGFTVHSVFAAAELFGYYYSKDRITEAEYDDILRFLADPLGQ